MPIKEKNIKGEKVASLLRDRLLQSPIKDYIMKIILFGSYAKDEYSKQSDVDILVVRKNGREAEELINDTIYDAIIDIGAPIETLICGVEDIVWVDNYFIYNILSYGKEVFTMDKKMLKKEAVQGLIRLADDYLLAAKNASKDKYYRLAVDGAYNAVELFVKALLLKELDDIPGSHGGIVQKFGQLFIKSGKLESSIGRNINQALQLRNWARYKWESKIGEEDFRLIYELAEKIRKEVESTYNF